MSEKPPFPASRRRPSLRGFGVAVLAVLSAAGLTGMFSEPLSDQRSPSSRPAAATLRPVAWSKPDLRPSWSKGAGAAEVAKVPNLSLLGRPDYEVPDSPDPVAEWLEPSDAGHGRLGSQMHEEWSGRMEEFEMRERHHLSGQNEQLQLSQNNWNMGRMYLRSLFATQVRQSLKKAEKQSEPVRVVSKAQQKLDFMANQGMKVELGPELRFGSKADIVRQRGRLWMDSPWLNGAVDFQVGGTTEKAPGSLVHGDERYRISVGRSLPWELSSGMVYGGSSRTMTTSLSRPLLPNLSCTLENRENLLQSSSEQMARLNYQLRF